MKKTLLISSFFLLSCDDSELTFIDSFPFEIKAEVVNKKEEFEEDKGRIFLDEIHPFEIDVIVNREIPNTEYEITYLASEDIEIKQNYEQADTLIQMKGKRNYEFIPKKTGNYKITFEAWDQREHYANHEIEFFVQERIKVIDFIPSERRRNTNDGARSEFKIDWHITGLQEGDDIILYYWTNNFEEITNNLKYYSDIQSHEIVFKEHIQHKYRGRVYLEIRRDKEILIKKRKVVDEWIYWSTT